MMNAGSLGVMSSERVGNECARRVLFRGKMNQYGDHRIDP
jgi:hypothetical protein